MSENVIKLRVDSQEYNAKIRRAAEGIQHYAAECRKISGTLSVVEDETLEFVRSLGQMETVSKSGMMGMRELTRAATDLTIQYRQLTDEEKNSPFGKGLKSSIDQIIQRASLMKDAMADVQREITGMASDTMMFNQIAGAAQFATTSFQTFQGASKLLGLQIGDNVEAIAKLQAAMAITSGLTQIQNLLQKESALMMGVSAVKTKAAAIAQNLLAKNTAAATAAAKAFNLVANANPIMLLVTALGAAVTAFALFGSSSEDAAKKSNEFMDQVNQTKTAVDELNASLKLNYELQSKQGRPPLDILKTQLQDAESEVERWKQKISELGGTDIPTVSIGWSKDISEEIKTEAANRSAALEEANKQLNEALKRRDDLAAKVSNEEDLRANALLGPLPTGRQTQRELESQLSILQDMLKDTTLLGNQRQEINGVIDKVRNALKQFDPTTNPVTNPTTTTNTTTQKILTEDQQISAQVTALIKEYQDLATAAKTADDAQKAGITERMTAIKGEIQTLQTRSDELKKFADDAKRIEYPTGSLPQLTQQMKELQDAQSKALNGEQWQKYQQAIEKTQVEIDKLKGKYQIIEGQSIQNSDVLNSFISGIKSDLEKADFGSAFYNSLSAQLADMTTLQNLVTQSLKAGLGTALFDVADETGADFWTRAMEGGVENVDWQKIIDKINEELKKKGLDTIGIDFGTGDTKGGGDSKAKYQPKSIADATNTLVSSVSGIFTGIEQLGIELPKGFKDVIGGIQGIMSILTAINTILGVIEGLQAVQSLPFFARGGIVPHAAAGYFVPGNHFSGDTTPIMANAGELILSRSQQNSIASQLTEAENRGGASGVARVSGEQIWVALNAYTKRTGKGELVTWR